MWAWIKKNLEGCDNPALKGMPLKGDWGGLWRYRVGDYRIISQIDEDEVRIIKIAHRKDV